MDDPDSSSLSSAPPTDDEKLAPIFLKAKGKAVKKKKKNVVSSPATTASPPKPTRPPSPPHEEVLADNPDIAFIVMFRSRFSAAFPPKLSHFGPQDIENGVVDSVPSPQVENLLCALLGLVLNRKKPVERGHHGRALEDAISTQKAQWPRRWNGVNPCRGDKNFNSMTPAERLDLLKTLIVWSLTSSEVISATIKESYKQSRHEDDLNQPLSVQPWGTDVDKRRFYLIEGQDDTAFRLYRESNHAQQNITWWSVAGSIDEVKAIAKKLEEEDTQASRRLAGRINAAIPRFEATEEKRKRREYRQFRKAQFSRPEPGFSLYEGRTRGKRMRYTYDDEDELMEDSDALSTRRSTRQSGRSTPAEARGPVVTASGRQVRGRTGGLYGESLLSGQTTTNADTPRTGDYEGSDATDELQQNGSGRATRSGGRSTVNPRKRKHIESYNSLDEMSDEEDAESSGNEWDGGDDEDDNMEDAEDDDEDDFLEDDEEDMVQRSLIVKLKVPKKPQSQGSARAPASPSASNGYDTLKENVSNEAASPAPGGKESASSDHPAVFHPQIMQDSSEPPTFSSEERQVTTHPEPKSPYQAPVAVQQPYSGASASNSHLPNFQQYAYQAPNQPVAYQQ